MKSAMKERNNTDFCEEWVNQTKRIIKEEYEEW